MVAKSTKAPGQGERIALSGLVPQTHYQIELILERLLEGDLEWFELASLEAGVADDLVLGLRGRRVWAYQFKHRSDGSLTFAQLVDPEGNEPRLLRELAEGWLSLRQQYANHEVRVTLLTNAPLSSIRFGASIEGEHLISDPTLRGFIDEVWEPYRASLLRGAGSYVVANEWQPRFEAWRKATGLDDLQFLNFARTFSICSEREPHPEHRLADDEDVNLLFRWLQRRVAEGAASGRPIRISSEEIKACLGAERFSYRNRHVFPIDSLYEPIEATGRKLESAIASIQSGYIAVIGSPGSGKSSLLEATLHRGRRTERIISYYAYVPDEPYPAHPRLDSTNFLHDLTKAIDDAVGTNPSVLPPRGDLSALRKRFGEQLLSLEEEFRSTGCKTIIIVDGLDHAQRPGALDIDRTFLSVLPEPHQIPHGVLVIVGTQHLRLELPTGILRQLDESGRRVEMDSLSPGQVERIVERAGVGPLLAQDRTPYQYRWIIARIVSLCDGHPLFMCALISRLRQAIADGQAVEAIVEQTPAYVGSIYAHYDYLWTQIEEGHRPRLREFVGQIARLHPDIDSRWVRSWDDLREEEQEFERCFAHLFVQVPPDRWRFFHNSFRLFLIDRSLETIDGPDPAEDARYHRRLADRCSTAPEDSQHQWSLVYHLARGGDDERLFQVATPSLFEKQYTNFRPPLELAADAKLCAQKATRSRKPVLLARYLLLWHRYNHAASILDDGASTRTLIGLLLKVGRPDLAIARVRFERRQLSAASESDLKRAYRDMFTLLDHLAGCGQSQAAAGVFEACEPRDIFDGARELEWDEYDMRDSLDLFESWMRAALSFYDARILLQRLWKIRWKRRETPRHSTDQSREVSENERDLFVRTVGVRVAQSLLCQQRWPAFDQLLTALEADWWPGDRTPFWWAHLVVQALHAPKTDPAWRAQHKGRLLERLPLERMRSSLKGLKEQEEDGLPITCVETVIGLAAALLPEDRATAAAYASILDWSDLRSAIKKELDRKYTDQADALDAIEWYAALHTFTRTPRPPLLDLASDLAESRHQDRQDALAALAIARLRVGILKGLAWRRRSNLPTVSADCNEHFQYLTTYFTRLRPTSQAADFVLLNATPVVARMLIDAAASAREIGPDALEAFVSYVRDAWAAENGTPCWPEELRRSVLGALGSDQQFARWREAEISRMASGEVRCAGSSYELIERRLARARDQVSLGEPEVALQEMRSALLCGFMPRSEKDHQIATIMEWLPSAVETARDHAERLQLLEEAAQQVALCRETAEGALDAAGSLIDAVLSWSPRAACGLLDEFSQEVMGGSWLGDGSAALISSALDRGRSAGDAMPASEVAALTAVFTTLSLGSQSYDRDITRLAEDLVLSAPTIGSVDRCAVGGRIWSAARFAMPDGEDRQQLAHALACALPSAANREAAGLLADDIPAPESRALREGTEQPYSLQLQDGTALHREDVVRVIIENPACAEHLIASEKPYEKGEYRRFEWGEVLRRTFPHVSPEGRDNLVGSLLRHGHKTSEIFDYARRLVERRELLDYEVALEAAQESISDDDVSRGWSRWFDGGVRMAGLRLLVAIEPLKWRPVAYDQFERALAGPVYLDSLVELPKLVDIFANEHERALIAREVSDHRRRTFIGADDPATLPIRTLRQEPADRQPDDLESACCGFVARLLGCPVNYIWQRAATEVVWLYDIAPAVVEREIALALQSTDEWLIEHALLVCEALASKGTLHGRIDKFRTLSSSENYGISESAKRTLLALGESPLPSEARKNVPRLAAPEERRIVVGEFYDRRSAIINRGFEPWFAALADQLRVPKHEVEAEVRALILQRGIGVHELRDAVESLNRNFRWVRSSFVRPNAIATRVALLRYLGRLLENGTVPSPVPGYMDSFFRGHDPALVGWWPTRRPAWVGPPEYSRDVDRDGEQWRMRPAVDCVTTEVTWAAPGEESTSWIVLAEETDFEFGESVRRAEGRQFWRLVAPLARDELKANLASGNSMVPGIHDLLFGDYSSSADRVEDGAIETLVVRANNFGFIGVIATDWVAPHPSAMKAIDLTLDPGFPPCWRTTDGSIGCLSIGWQDGTSMHRHYHELAPAGSGWCVLLRADLWEQLKANLQKPPTAVTGIRRELQNPEGSEWVTTWKECWIFV